MVNDVVNSILGYSKATGKLCLRYARQKQATNFLNVVCAEFRSRIAFAFVVYGFKITALVQHILRVVFQSSEKQMIGIDTRRVVATMKHEESLGKTAMSRFKGESMGESFPGTRDFCYAVSSFIAFSLVQPTVRGLINSRPKTPYSLSGRHNRSAYWFNHNVKFITV